MKKRIFKSNYVFSVVLLLFSFTASAQFDKKSERASRPDKISGRVHGVKVDVQYSSPAVNGRKVFGELVPFGQLWRTGANEATIIEFSDNVIVEGKELPKGKYALYTIPNQNQWVIIFNKEYDQWGSFNYDQKTDALRVNALPSKSDFHEKMEFSINEDGQLELYWEETKVAFTISKPNL